MLLQENDQWLGGVMWPDTKQSYCYHHKFDYFPLYINQHLLKCCVPLKPLQVANSNFFNLLFLFFKNIFIDDIAESCKMQKTLSTIIYSVNLTIAI